MPVSELSQTSKLALGLIYTHSLIAGDRKAKLTQKKLGMFLAKSVDGVKYVIKSLTEKGYIEKSQQLGYVCKKEYKQHYRIDLKIFDYPSLTSSEKLLFGVITSKASRCGYCYATNKKLSQDIGLKVTEKKKTSYGNQVHIGKLLKSLHEHRFITVEEGAISKDLHASYDKEGNTFAYRRKIIYSPDYTPPNYWVQFNRESDKHLEKIQKEREEEREMRKYMREVEKRVNQNSEIDGCIDYGDGDTAFMDIIKQSRMKQGMAVGVT